MINLRFSATNSILFKKKNDEDKLTTKKQVKYHEPLDKFFQNRILIWRNFIYSNIIFIYIDINLYDL